MPAWLTYVVLCADDTLYCGVTSDLVRRLHEHNHTPRAARYTRARRPVEVVARWSFDSRADAQRFEARFKKLERAAKLDLLREASGSEATTAKDQHPGQEQPENGRAYSG